MITKRYRYVTCSKELGSDVIISEFSENLKVDLATAKELVANRLDFTNNEKHYTLIDCSNSQQITSDAKAYLQAPEGGLKNILATAFVGSNQVSVMIANVFLRTKAKFPIKFFVTKTAAYNWLKELSEKRKEFKQYRF